MIEYAEMFALVHKGETKGYRIYITEDGFVTCYDFQTENTSLSTWVNGRLQLKQVGNLLMTQDEINKEVSPKQLYNRDKSLIKNLLGQVKHFYQLAH